MATSKSKATEEVVATEMKEVKAATAETELEASHQAPQRKEKKKIDLNEMIPLKNLTSGSLIYVSKRTGLITEWEKLGDVQYMEWQEVMNMKSSQPRFTNEPWVEIMDEDAVENLGLKSVYEKLVPADELDQFFMKAPKEIEQFLRVAPQGTRKLIGDKAAELVRNRQLVNVLTIKTLERELSIDLLDLLEL